MLYAVTLLQCGECQNIDGLLGRCYDKLSCTVKDMKSKLERRLVYRETECEKPEAMVQKSYCKSLEINDCRCLMQEHGRNADSIAENAQEKLDFLEFLNSNAEIATTCNIKNNADCSAAADKVIRNIFPERNTKLENDLRRRSRACVDRARQVVPSCRSFIDAVQQTESSETAVQKTCFDALSGAGLDEECLCLILEADKANPNAPKPAIEKQMIEVLKFVTADEGRTRKCISNTNKLDCSGVTKSLKRIVDLRSLGNAGKDLNDPQKCDKAALEAMEMCSSKVDAMGPGNTEKLESLSCCNELQRISGAGCGCKLGTTVPTTKDVVEFLERIRSKRDNLVKSFPGFNLDGTLKCKVATGNKNPALFETCELKAQEAVKTCAPVAMKPIPDSNSPKVDSIKPCCFLDGDLGNDDCVMCDSQTMRCCEQLTALSRKGTNSCLCKVAQNRVASRANTAPFLNAHALLDVPNHASVVRKTCDRVMQFSTMSCIDHVIDRRPGFNLMGEQIADSLKSRTRIFIYGPVQQNIQFQSGSWIKCSR